MKLTKNFTLEEMTASDTARKHGISNTPCEEHEANLRRLCERILQPLRDAWGSPITVNCGYRSVETNKALAADYKKAGKNIYVSMTSQHCTGQAADITVGSPEKNKQLFQLIQRLGLPFDQLIDEYGYRWLHVSYSPRMRHQILHY